jgi:alcohol dehydrogenase class IV
MTSFELATAARILFGPGRLADAPAEIAALGLRRVLLVTGRSRVRAAPLEAGLGARGVAAVPLSVEGEPTVALAREGTALAVAERCDGVVAMGGGSALDGGKAIAALAASGADPLDHLEVIGQGRPPPRPALPFVAIPTTAGTGSEVTRNAVLGAPEARVKASLRHPSMLARLAVVDPELLAGLPRAVLTASGLDALSQLVEPYLSCRANPVTDALAAEGMRRSARSLRRACLLGADAAAREDLALASLLGGLCLANSGLGAVHGFAGPAGGMFDAPHGALCAAFLVPALGVNLRALRSRAPAGPGEGRFRQVAAWLTDRRDATAEDGLAWLAALCRELGVAGLASHGMSAADVPALVARAKASSSLRGNPIALTDGELAEIAERSLASP